MTTALDEYIDEEHLCDVANVLRIDAFSRLSTCGYREGVPQRRSTPARPTAWMSYLRGIQDRHGWSIARVERESAGRIHRSTLFRMLSGETRRVPLETVKLVAEIVGDDPEEVLASVAGSVYEERASDPRLGGLDPNDEVVKLILSLDVDEAQRDRMLNRRRHILAERARADLEEVQFWADQARLLSSKDSEHAA